LEGRLIRDYDWTEIIPDIRRTVPLSVTELKMILDVLDEGYWRDFACRRPEVRSILSYKPRIAARRVCSMHCCPIVTPPSF